MFDFLNVGTVHMRCILNIGTVPTWCIKKVGRVPMFNFSLFVISQRAVKYQIEANGIELAILIKKKVLNIFTDFHHQPKYSFYTVTIPGYLLCLYGTKHSFPINFIYVKKLENYKTFNFQCINWVENCYKFVLILLPFCKENHEILKKLDFWHVYPSFWLYSSFYQGPLVYVGR